MSFRELLADIDNEPVSEAQLKFIRGLMEEKNIHVYQIIEDGFPPLEKLTKGIASELLEYLMKSRHVDPYASRGSEGGYISEFLPTIDINDL